MCFIRTIKNDDFDAVAQMEIEISKISFKDKAITDPAFHRKKLERVKDRTGMFVIASDHDDILGFIWMEKKTNSLTGDIYSNFKSFYIHESIRGNTIVDEFFEKGIEYSKQCGAQYIVGKVHANNIAMRALYKNHRFFPTHITMEMSLDEYKQ